MAQPSPFLVFSLPRSRTAWLSKFLSYGQWTCEHDPSALWHSRNDMEALLSRPFTGACDSAMVFLWEHALAVNPEVKFVVVRRERALVEAALARLGLFIDSALLSAAERKLDEVSALLGTLTVTFDELCSAFVCGRLMEHCLGQPFDPVWWKALHNVNIQVDLRAMLQTMALNRDGIAKTYEGVTL